jgi:dihydroxyacetone kinase-like predicted kinase
VAGDELIGTLLRLLDAMQAGEREIIALYYGAEISEAAAEQAAEAIRERYPDQSVELHLGGQPHYQFILSVE